MWRRGSEVRRDRTEEPRESASFHGAAHDRRHARSPRPYQSRSIPARNHRRRDAAPSVVPRVSSQFPGRGMSELTHVELLWIRKQVENRVRFGRSVDQHIIDRQWRVVSFEAGRHFAFFPLAGNGSRTNLSRTDFLPTPAPSTTYT